MDKLVDFCLFFLGISLKMILTRPLNFFPQSCWSSRSTPPRQKTKQVQADHVSGFAQTLTSPPPAVLPSTLPTCFSLFHAASCDEDDCQKNQICEQTSAGSVNCTCAPGFYGDKCEGSVPAGAEVWGWGGGRGAELCYPAGMLALRPGRGCRDDGLA